MQAGDKVIAVVERVGTTNAKQYLHRDHQGSVTKVTNASGTVDQALAFDAWGLRRNASDWSPLTNPFSGSHETERGYTGHEHLDTVGLIHMNGRVQDPILGRFISADPFIQAPFNTQSHNRYSYVWNNPASLVDPSGFGSELPSWACETSAECTLTEQRPASCDSWCRDFFARHSGEFGILTGDAYWEWVDQFFGSGGAGNRSGRSAPPVVPNNPCPSCHSNDGRFASTGGTDGLHRLGPILDGAFRSLVYDYRNPLGGSYLLEAVTLIPIAKVAKVLKYGDEAAGFLRGSDDVPNATRFGPLNPGPLADDVERTFRSGTYTQRALTSDTTLFRVISDTGNPTGPYWTATRPQGPLQSVIDSALDQDWRNTASRVVTARVPAGTTIYEGAAAAQRGLVGGGNQIYIPRVDPTWIE